MIQEIRIYKQFDTDLVALCAAGYPITDMLREAITGFANETPVKFDIKDIVYFDMNNKQSVKTRVSITDKKAIAVLKNIKHGYRNSFCKCVLRNALSQQNLAAFFADDSMLDLCRPKSSAAVVRADIVPAEPVSFLEPQQPVAPVVTQPVKPVEQKPQLSPIPVMEESAIVHQAEPVNTENLPVDTGSYDEVDDDSILDAFDAL